MDDELRGRERVARHGAADQAQLLAAQVRAGRLEAWRLRLGARLGDPAAQLACPDVPAAQDVESLCRGLEADGGSEEAWARLIIAMTTVLAEADPGKIFDVIAHAERLVVHGGASGPDEALEHLADACWAEARPRLAFALERGRDGVDLGVAERDLLERARREVGPWSTGQGDPLRARRPPRDDEHERTGPGRSAGPETNSTKIG